MQEVRNLLLIENGAHSDTWHFAYPATWGCTSVKGALCCLAVCSDHPFYSAEYKRLEEVSSAREVWSLYEQRERCELPDDTPHTSSPTRQGSASFFYTKNCTNTFVYPTPVLHSVIKTTEGGAERPETGPSTLLMWRTSQTTISCTIIMAQKSFFPWKMLFEREMDYGIPHACLFSAVITNDAVWPQHVCAAQSWVAHASYRLLSERAFVVSFLKLY